VNDNLEDVDVDGRAIDQFKCTLKMGREGLDWINLLEDGVQL
jgi:hypothetical protein